MIHAYLKRFNKHLLYYNKKNICLLYLTLYIIFPRPRYFDSGAKILLSKKAVDLRLLFARYLQKKQQLKLESKPS